MQPVRKLEALNSFSPFILPIQSETKPEGRSRILVGLISSVKDLWRSPHRHTQRFPVLPNVKSSTSIHHSVQGIKDYFGVIWASYLLGVPVVGSTA